METKTTSLPKYTIRGKISRVNELFAQYSNCKQKTLQSSDYIQEADNTEAENKNTHRDMVTCRHHRKIRPTKWWWLKGFKVSIPIIYSYITCFQVLQCIHNIIKELIQMGENPVIIIHVNSSICEHVSQKKKEKKNAMLTL